MAEAEVKDTSYANSAEFDNPWERMSDQGISDDSSDVCTCHQAGDDSKVQENVVGQMLLRERQEASTPPPVSLPEIVVQQPPMKSPEHAEESIPLAGEIAHVPELSPLYAEDLPDTHIALAWLVTLCFNVPLGVVAVCMSIKAAKLFVEGKRKEGHRYTRFSLYASLAGIVLTVVIVMSAVLYLAVKEAADRRKRLRG